MSLNGGTSRKSRVFVVDDHPIVRQGLALLINREDDLAARPDILIVDISLNGPDGLDLLKDVRMRYPELPVLILSMHDESIYAERALRAGAQGYIMKQEATEKVLVAVRRILSREIYISERIANRMLQRYIGNRSAGRPSSIADLTDRELEVFRLTTRLPDVL
jgi:DNA-binding NarL/FixJ family response regulator